MLEARKATKLHKHDMTSSYDEFLRYAQPYKLIPTTSTTPLVSNETLDLYHEGATLYKFIDEGRPTTTKRLSLLFEPSDKLIRRLYGTPATKTTSTIIEVKNDKCLQFHVNWLNITRDTSIKAWTKNSSQTFEFSFLP